MPVKGDKLDFSCGIQGYKKRFHAYYIFPSITIPIIRKLAAFLPSIFRLKTIKENNLQNNACFSDFIKALNNKTLHLLS